MKNKYSLVASIVALLSILIPGAVTFADPPVPANTSINFLRSDPSEVVTGGPFYKNASLLLTNCVLYAATTTNGAVQNLTDCTVVAKVGSATTSYLTATGTVQSAASGTWYVQFTVPTNTDNSAILQVTVSHTNGTSYIYNWKVLPLRTSI